MWKYLRLVFPLILSYFIFLLPTYLTRRWTSIDYRYRQVRRAVKMVFPFLKVDVHLDHPEVAQTKEPYFIVSNHYSMVDPFLMIYIMEQPIRFISKREVKGFPIFGIGTISLEAAYIDRDNVRSQIKAFKIMRESMLQRNTRWVLYPEGTRNRQYGDKILPFKAGSFKVAMETQTSILPMVAYGFHRPIHKKFHFKRYPVQIDFLPPITPEMYAGKTTQEVADIIHDQMEQRLKSMVVKDQLLLSPKR